MAAKEAAAAKGGPANKKAVLTVEKLLTFIPEHTTIEQGQLKALIEKAGYPEKPTRDVIKDALEARAIFEHKFKRFGVRPENHLARYPQQKMVRPSAQNQSEKR